MDLRGKMTLYVPEVLAIIKYVRNLRNKGQKNYRWRIDSYYFIPLKFHVMYEYQ